MGYTAPNAPGQNRFDFTILFYIAIFGIPLLWKWWQVRRAKSVIVESSLLISLFTNGVGLNKVSDGVLNSGLRYILLITGSITKLRTPPLDLPSRNKSFENIEMMASSNSGKIIMSITLPDKSSVHIACLGIPDKKTHKSVDEIAKQHNLETASLEGDFPDYFSLYCSPDKQLELREVLDPATMLFLVDYCKKEDWEIYSNTLYFTQSTMASKSELSRVDNSTMVKDAEEFAQKILPKIQNL